MPYSLELYSNLFLPTPTTPPQPPDALFWAKITLKGKQLTTPPQPPDALFWAKITLKGKQLTFSPPLSKITLKGKQLTFSPPPCLKSHWKVNS